MAHYLGVEPAMIEKGLQLPVSVNLRMEVIRTKSGKWILADCYNASPESMEAAIQALMTFKGENRRLGAILGDMLELGKFSESAHREIGRKLNSCGIHGVMGIGSWSQCILEEMDIKHKYGFVKVENVIPNLSEMAKNWDVVLIKGSHGMQLEKLLPEILRL